MKKIISFFILMMFSLSVMAGEIPGQRNTFGDASAEISSDQGKVTISGVNNTNNNSIEIDTETNVDSVDLSSDDNTIKLKRHRNGHFACVQKYNGSTYSDFTTEACTTKGDSYIFLGNTNDILYIGSQTKFSKVYFDMYIQGSGITKVVEYSKGGGVWATLNLISDGTNNFANDGAFILNPPGDWGADVVNSISLPYWIRVKATVIPSAISAYLTIPNNNNIYEIYGNYGDTSPMFKIDVNGDVIFGRGDMNQLDRVYFKGVSTDFDSSSPVSVNKITPYTYISYPYTITLTNGSTISITYLGTGRIAGSGGAVTANATTPISAGSSSQNGRRISFLGTSDTNTVTIPNSGNVLLTDAWVGGLGDYLEVEWYHAISKWVEVGRNMKA